MRARSAPRSTCRSAAPRTRATATARRVRPRSTSSPNGSRSMSTTRESCRRRRSTPSLDALAHPCPASSTDGAGLGEREDVKELDVEPVRGQARGLGDAVLLLEDEQELARVELVGAVELLEPEAERRGLLARDEEQLGLDVVGAAELVPFAQDELPALPRRDPVLDRCREHAQRLVDLDLEGCVGTLGRRGAGLDLKGGHGGRVPAD